MESKSVYLSPSDATDENGFTILKLKFRKVPSFLDKPMRQLSSKVPVSVISSIFIQQVIF